MRNITTILFKNIFTLSLVLSFALAPLGNAKAEEMDGLVDDTKQDLLTVVGAGLAGAILGLSTLSFVEEPKKHTKNILMGASLGIIVGVGVVAFSQANKSKDLIYGPEGSDIVHYNPKTFNTLARSSWHESTTSENISIINTNTPYYFNYTFSY